MKRVVLCLWVCASSCWCQIKPTRVEVMTPVVVKLETPPQSAWLLFVQNAVPSTLGAAIGALSAIGAVFFSQKREMRKWRVEKQFEVLSRIFQLLVQTRRALGNYEEATERCEKYVQAQVARAERDAVDDARRNAFQELSIKREELAAANGSGGLCLSEVLWHELQSVEQTLADVCNPAHERNTRAGRTEQLRELDGEIEKFMQAARKEIESGSG